MFKLFLPLINKNRFAVACFTLLSVTDLILTKISLDYLGATEANPVMSLFFSASFIGAVVFKGLMILLVGLITGHLWSRIEVRFILAAGNLLMVLVVFYELAGVLGGLYGR